MTPAIVGIEVCRRLRTVSDACVSTLTTRAEEVDTLVGLSVGADDCLTEPCSTCVLVAPDPHPAASAWHWRGPSDVAPE